MGKSKKSKGSRGVSLADQVLEDKIAKPSGRVKRQKGDDKDDSYVDDRLSRKILAQAKKQQEELEEEHGVAGQSIEKKPINFVQLGARGGKSDSEDSEDDDDDDDESEEFYENIEVDAEDEKALEMFMSHKQPTRRTLADIIMEKITEKQTEIRSQMTDNASVQMEQLDERVVNMYSSIRKILCKYRSGKLPKAFKIVPSLKNWEQILYITEPETWSAAAVYQATRLFASNMNARMAQRFFNLVLLPRVRDDISEYKRLNYHLFMALKKSLFKPAAFFKGILLPLCDAGNCTLREAIIISSVLVKTSIPMLHSAAAILKIAEMDYNGANSIFLKSLLDKKYALPYRVIDAVVFHFLGFTTDQRELPVLWHQCLLTFVQRYKEDISSEQKDSMMDLLRAHKHPELTTEIRRELVKSKCRDVEVWEGSNIEV